MLELTYVLPALVSACFGIWILKRGTGGVTRMVGYLLATVGIAILMGVAVLSLVSLVYGLPGFL